MKHFSNINILQVLKSIWKEIRGFCISAFVTLAHAASNLNSFNHEIKYKKKKGQQNTHEKKILTHKIWTHKIHTRKNFRPMKCPREKF